MTASYISRRLTWTDKDLRAQEIEDKHVIRTFSQPVVILGDPGMGKTRLMETLSAEGGCRFIRAASFLRQLSDDFTTTRLVIDGLDEVAAIEEGDPLHNVLKKLVACGKPRFIISCRSAEWRSAAGKIDIAEEYGETPRELTLLPLTRDEAIEALICGLDADRANQAIYGLDQAGLEELYGNPLTLNFVGAIVADEGEIPQSRAELFARAVARLRQESNDRHAQSALAQLSEEDALDAAGAVMAAMLITGHESITSETKGDGTLAVADLSDIVDQISIRAVLGSNLFRADTLRSGHHIPMHRTVAEFLAARWICRHIETMSHPSRAALRLFGLISAEGGVPSSLRGLHAWLPKFSHARLGPKAIDRDPYGVLRYGDGDGLTAKQATQLIGDLRRLAAFNPFFRNYWGEKIALKGLAQPALKDELRSILLDQSEPPQLRALILEAVNGNEIAYSLRGELEQISFDPKRNFHERREAAEALANIGPNALDWTGGIEKLVELADEDSTRLAVEMFRFVDLANIPDNLVARAVVTEAGILAGPNHKRRHTLGPLYLLAQSLPMGRVTGVLDSLAALLLPTLDPEKWWDQGYHDGWFEFSGFADHLIRRQLEHDEAAIGPRQLWDWMRALERERDTHRDDRKAIAELLRSNDRLRQGVQRLALFAPGTGDKFFPRSWRLHYICQGLGLTEGDARLYLQEVVARDDPKERERWMYLVAHFRTDGRIPKDVQVLARPYATHDKELCDFLTKKPTKAKLDEWEKKHRRKERADARAREKAIAKAREDFTTHIGEVKLGELKWIIDPARAYLGMFSDLEREGQPADRIGEWLGAATQNAAVEGFDAVLYRLDLPNADQIAQSYAESKRWNFVFPMLAGAGQRLIDGRNFGDLPPDLLSAVSIAAEHELLSPREQLKGLKEAIDAQLRKDPVAYEAHIRRKIEAMLRAGRSHVEGLYQFARQDTERPLSTRLCLEWLEQFPDLPFEVESELAHSVLSAPREERPTAWPILAAIVRQRLGEEQAETEREKLWIPLHFVFDLEEAVARLPALTMENRDWLWALTSAFYSRFGGGERNTMSASVAQLNWIIATFRTLWPYTDRPTGMTSGDQNPWDATNLLEWAIYQIAKYDSGDAANALTELRAMPADGYSVVVQAAIAEQHKMKLETLFESPNSRSSRRF